MIDTTTKKDVVQKLLKDAHETLNSRQFYGRKAPFILYRIFDEVNKRELHKNCVLNVLKVELENIPQDANVISPHFFCKIKPEADEKGMKKY